MPSFNVVRKPDGKFPLVYTQEYRMVQAEIKDKMLMALTLF
jgi:hypothetical protein